MPCLYVHSRIATKKCQRVFVNSSWSFDEENTTNLVLKMTLVFLSGLVQNVLKNQMGDEVTPLDSFLCGPAFTLLCMCIITNQSNVPQRNSKDNVDIQIINIKLYKIL